MKQCEICEKEIPEDYQNLLCPDCYVVVEKENARKLALEEEEKQKTIGVSTPDQTTPEQPVLPQKGGITDPNYQENPEKEDKEQWMTNLSMFERHGVILWKPTKQMYEFVKTENLNRVTSHPQYPKFIWKPKIVDVGCGVGVGSNILSQEADFVWGIDKNHKTIMFAKQCFERIKNGIYYSSQVSFEEIDIMADTREFLKFDEVVAIEVIEHIADYKKFLKTIIEKFDKKNKEEPTIYYISTPNRNNKHIQQDKPHNIFHIREWTSSELYDILKEYFNQVKFYNSAGKEIPENEYRTTTHTPLLAQCSQVRI